MNEQQRNISAHQLAYRKAERDKADLMYENQILRTKIVTISVLWALTVVILVTAIFVNATK